jgi:hypothetical protein
MSSRPEERSETKDRDENVRIGPQTSLTAPDLHPQMLPTLLLIHLLRNRLDTLSDRMQALFECGQLLFPFEFVRSALHPPLQRRDSSA